MNSYNSSYQSSNSPFKTFTLDFITYYTTIMEFINQNFATTSIVNVLIVSTAN